MGQTESILEPVLQREIGIAAAKAGDFGAALSQFRQAGDWYNESVTLAVARMYEEAIAAAGKGLLLDPVKAHKQIMSVYWEVGDREKAKQHIDAGLSIAPNDSALRTARGAWRLAGGDLGGWEDAEFRPWAQAQRDSCDEVPEWDGRQLDGKSLLIIYQDGIGDQVMYSRFLDGLGERYGASRVVLLADPQTARFFWESFDVEVVGSWDQIGEVDCWIGSTSLGKLRLPITGAPYLYVPEERVNRFAGYMGDGKALRVGLVWAGQPLHTQDRNRSLPFGWFEPLLGIPGVEFYSLQFGKDNLDHGGRIRQLSAYCKDVADTAAAVKNLDLVIGVDTGINHFSGALGISTWALCRTPIDWRWGLEGSKSYWYDSVRVWRNATVEHIREALVRFALRTDSLPRKRGSTVQPVGPVTVHENCRYGRIAHFTHDLWCGRSLEEYGEWSEGEMDLLRAVLPKGEAVVIEAGANAGCHTLGLAKHCGFVNAFEPQVEIFDLLVQNLKTNGVSNVLAFNSGLGAKPEVRHYLRADPNFVTHPEATNMREAAGEHTNKASITTVDLAAVTLTRLDMIKADVEGMEVEVLRGAEKTIARLRPLLYLENNDAADRTELLKLVDKLGYRIYQHEIPLFNRGNFANNPCNVFGMWDSRMIFCVPRERFDLRSIIRQLRRIRL